MQDLNFQQQLVNSFIIIGANDRSRFKNVRTITV
ncbi:hypothetical protein B0O79_2816 [Flavobacteriaceae bacterium MAR_2009_75]|nr:hypothetical protein B0O79_2816 [Flavobacteriaceae bacterium MAR_2009_75]